MSHTIVRISKEIPATGTRPAGKAAREQILDMLGRFEALTLDFESVILTPSFADEFIGGLIIVLGEHEFHDRIQLVHLSPSAQPLVRHVTNLRSEKRRTDDIHAH